MLTANLVGATVEVGDNLAFVLITITNLVASIIAGGAAVRASKAAVEARRQSLPNGGSSMRDAVDRAERIARSAALVAGVPAHELPPPPPPAPAPSTTL